LESTDGAPQCFVRFVTQKWIGSDETDPLGASLARPLPQAVLTNKEPLSGPLHSRGFLLWHQAFQPTTNQGDGSGQEDGLCLL
jgi:hypothetical protein